VHVRSLRSGDFVWLSSFAVLVVVSLPHAALLGG
jgi:hypothetical protein